MMGFLSESPASIVDKVEALMARVIMQISPDAAQIQDRDDDAYHAGRSNRSDCA
jgi:hypothetical protein